MKYFMSDHPLAGSLALVCMKLKAHSIKNPRYRNGIRDSSFSYHQSLITPTHFQSPCSGNPQMAS